MTKRSSFSPAFRLICLGALLGLCGCHSLFGSDESDKNKVQGTRISVLQQVSKVEVDKDVQGTKIEVAPELATTEWAQSGMTAEHQPQDPAFGMGKTDLWQTSIGDGSDGDYKLLAQPVVASDRVFTMDSRGTVSATRLKNGDGLWSFDTTPEDRDGEAMGGGLGVDQNTVYATTGFGEVVALDAKTGKAKWRKMVGKPLRSPPALSDGRVFVVTIDNELYALLQATGEILWHHSGIAESATLMGASAPAVSGDSVVVAYSSGEIFNLRAQNGKVAWTDVLAMPAQRGAMPAIADIRGDPVIDKGVVYAVSHSGRMAAINLRTGDRLWDADVGGTNTPVVAENAVFVLSTSSEVVAVTKETGRVIWIKQLQTHEDPKDRDSDKVFWSGPVLAGSRLWLANSLGHLVSLAVTDGSELSNREVFDDPIFIPPVVSDLKMILVSDDADLKVVK